MRTSIKFALKNPTREKWDLYITLIPKIDKIIRNSGVELLSRKLQERGYLIFVEDEYQDEEKYLQMTFDIINLTNSHKITFNVLEKFNHPNPQGFKTSLTLRLREGYRSKENWEKWLDKMPDISEACMFHGVYLSRELDMKNFSVRTTAKYSKQSEIASAFFYSGWIYGNLNIPLEISDIFEESYSLDLIEDIKQITNNRNNRK